MTRRMLVPIAVALAVSMLVVLNGVSVAQVVPAQPSDLVTLIPSGASCPFGGARMSLRILSDGSAVQGFSPPPGSVLVITDWQWGPVVRGVNAWEGAGLTLQSNAIGSILVGLSGGNTGGAQGGDGRTGSGPSIMNMIAVKPGIFICITMESQTGVPAVVHGFLAPDE